MAHKSVMTTERVKIFILNMAIFFGLELRLLFCLDTWLGDALVIRFC